MVFIRPILWSIHTTPFLSLDCEQYLHHYTQQTLHDIYPKNYRPIPVARSLQLLHAVLFWESWCVADWEREAQYATTKIVAYIFSDDSACIRLALHSAETTVLTTFLFSIYYLSAITGYASLFDGSCKPFSDNRSCTMSDVGAEISERTLDQCAPAEMNSAVDRVSTPTQARVESWPKRVSDVAIISGGYRVLIAAEYRRDEPGRL